MKIVIELPEDIAQALHEKWGDLSQHAVQLIAVEAYRSGILTPEQLHRMLSLRTRLEVTSFLKERGIHVEYSQEDRDKDLETLQRLPQP